MVVSLNRAFALCILFAHSQAAFDLGWPAGDSDLTSFVTRPEIKAPLFTVLKKVPEKIAPGYWFVAPYARVLSPELQKNYYQACQTGPAIYDGDGTLIWSGACLSRNQNACDFRLNPTNDDSVTMSAIMMHQLGGGDHVGHGIVLNNAYNITETLSNPVTIKTMNMHELNIQNGNSAIHILGKPSYVDLGGLSVAARQPAGWVYDMGFREIDLATGDTLFEWWALESGEVNLTESSRYPSNVQGPPPTAWNWFHANAVDKNAYGDYLFNSRYLSTIFKISGETGKVLWRLGGKKSSFVLQDFNFSREHDPRWLETGETRDIITFLDNASADDEYGAETSNTSRALTVELNYETMTARKLQVIERPDGGLSRLRGNVQTLPNGNKFVCWSENAKMSEHDADGNLLMYAEFQTSRFVTYRGYKFDNFVGMPSESPAIKAYAFGATSGSATLVIYVSWNGATEVKFWQFRDAVTGDYLGETEKTGFETTFQVDGFRSEVLAEALAANGSRIGSTPGEQVVLPDSWNLAFNPIPWPNAQSEIIAPYRGGNTSIPVTNEEGRISVTREWMYSTILLAFASGTAIGYSVYYLRSKRKTTARHLRTLASPQESQRLTLSPTSPS